MNKPLTFVLLALAVWQSAVCSAQPAAAPAPPVAPKLPAREIFVPFDDLNVVLGSPTRRVFISREQYDELVAKAKKSPTTKPPLDAAILAADYEGVIEEGRARMTGKLDIEVLSEGLKMLALDLSAVGVRSATLDGKGASIGRDPAGHPMLFVEGVGRHQLVLELDIPLITSAARQTLDYQLPMGPAASLKLTVPGNVEVKSGARVIERVVDEKAGVTRLTMLAERGHTCLIMSLNNKQLRKERVVVARSVIVDELTEAYERLHITASLGILHGATDQFRFVVPKGFEIATVNTPLLAKWNVTENAEKAGERILEVRLREATTETVVLNIAAVRAPAVLENWTLPKLEPLDMAGQVAVVGLLVENRLEAQDIEAEGLIPIDTKVISEALPSSVTAGDAGSAPVRAIVAYYAPGAAFKLSAKFIKPPVRVRVTTNLLLQIEEKAHEVRGGFALLPLAEKLFAIDFSAPAGWQVVEVTRSDNQPLSFESYTTENGAGRIHVRLAEGIAIGQNTSIYFRAVHSPEGWLADWKSKDIKFPVFAVADATRDLGAIAVVVRDDLSVRPDKLTALTPLDENEKAKYGLGGVPTNLAYRYDAQPYSAEIHVERTEPRLTARVYSGLRIEPDLLVAHYEVTYNVTDARTMRLALLLPLSTPEELAIRGLDGVALKEYTSEVVGDLRRWNVLLAEPHSGRIRLAVDFQQRKPKQELEESSVPLIRAADVAYQSGLVSIEGSAELDVELSSHPRKVDVGELVDAEYQPGQRLLGVFAYAGDSTELKLRVYRHPGYGLPAAIVERSELVTLVSTSGQSQSASRFLLRTKALFLEVKLPPGSTLWSAYLDGAPTLPQREGRSVLLSLPAAAESALRDLQFVYETPVNDVKLAADLELAAPKLYLRTDQKSDSVELPVADLVWHLHLPSGYRVIRAGGTVFPTDASLRAAPGSALAKAMYTIGGGVHQHYPLSAPYKSRETMVAGVKTPGSVGYYDRFSASKDAKSDSDALSHFAETGTNIDYPADAVEWDAKGDVKVLEDSYAAPEITTKGNYSDLSRNRTRGFRAPRQSARPGKPAAAPLTEPEIEKFEPGETPIEASQLNTDTLSLSVPPMQQDDEAALGGVGGGFEPQSRGAGQRFKIAKKKGLPLIEKKLDESVLFGAAVGGPVVSSSGGVPGGGGVANGTGVISRPTGAPQTPQYWALEGVRSLKIDLRQMGEGVTFQSLGADPLLAVTLANRERIGALAWGTALALGLVGVALTNRSRRAKVTLIAGVLIASTVLPPLVGWNQQMSAMFDMATLVACLLVIYYLLVSPIRWVWSRIRLALPRPVVVAAASCLALACLSIASTTYAQAPPAVEPTTPVNVPDDAIIVPFDLGAPNGLEAAAKLLIPYDKYVELWNQAYPDKKIETPAAPAPFALAGAEYTATLGGGDDLLVTGHVDIDVFADGVVQIPLALEGGALAAATLNGKPARLRAVDVQPMPVDEKNAQQKAPQAAAAKPAGAFVILYASGKGRQRLELAVRFHLERRGGWRVAGGKLPSAAASSLTFTAPNKQTEVEFSGPFELPNLQTKQDNEKIATSLGAEGAFRVQWRPKIEAAQVDQSLTVDSVAVLDVQEDGLQLLWQMTLQFRRSQRQSFTIEVPDGYLVEKISGPNVRGWQLKPDEKKQLVEVTLLKSAQDSESLALQLSRRGAVGAGELAQFDAPVLTVRDAALHHGEMVIRRSPWLELRTEAMTGATRTDSATNLADQAVASPLGIVRYQAFRFAAVPFSVRLAVEPIETKLSANVQTVLKVAQRDRTLESRVNLHVDGRPAYRVRVELPQDFKLDQVIAPEPFQWTVTNENNRPILSVYLTTGQAGDFSVVLRGALGEQAMQADIEAPRIVVLDVARQEGDIVVQADPAFNVSAKNLDKIETVLLSRVFAWLEPAQQKLARIALHYRSPDYTATIGVSTRRATVSAMTVTNVRVTDRAFEETILLDFTIREAGIRQLSFLLPSSMKGARISAPMLRQKTITQVDGPNGPALRVRLELQDEVMDQLRVLVENDRLVSSEKYSAPIPTVENAPAERRYVTIEGAGRDEVIVDSATGLDLLGRQQAEWKMLSDILGRGMTQAYIVRGETEKPQLVIHTQDRAAVETAGARIGLARTTLVLDANGAYRATQTYRVDNSTEQFLDIELPAGAELWTAHVAGAAVKPTRVPGAAESRARIPLVKTAAGDRDFSVVLKYGGKMEPLGTLRKLDFPMIRTLNVNVELSQVDLRLPDTYRWFDFGGTTSMVRDEAELAAGDVAYKTEQIKRLTQILSSSNPYARLRACNTIRGLESEIKVFQYNNGRFGNNAKLKENLDLNAKVIEQAEQQIKQQVDTPTEAAPQDNRGRLNDFYNGQANSRSLNVVNGLGGNFNADVNVKSGKAVTQFNKLWFDQNELNKDLSGPMDEAKSKPKGEAAGAKMADDKSSGAKSEGKPGYDAPNSAQPAAPEVAQGKAKEELREKNAAGQQAGPQNGQAQGQNALQEDGRSQLFRYQQRLQKQEQLQQQLDDNAPAKKPAQKFGDQVRDGQMAGEQIDKTENGAVPHDWRMYTEGHLEVPANAPAREGATPTTALASLDVQLPSRGVQFLMMTPRGEVEVTARAVANPLIDRLKNLGISLAVILAALVIYKIICAAIRGILPLWLSLLALSVLGLASLVSGIFPFAGLAAWAVAIGLLVRRAVSKRPVVVAAT